VQTLHSKTNFTHYTKNAHAGSEKKYN